MQDNNEDIVLPSPDEALVVLLADGAAHDAAQQFWRDAAAELARAQAKYPAMHSAHEAYAVLLEEIEEVWALVKVKQANHDHAAMRAELVQVAAMAARFALDVLDSEGAQ